MPTLLSIARWWHDRPDRWPDLKSHYIGFGEPFCFRCGWLAPVDDDDATTTRQSWSMAGRWLDRAHLVDRVAGGLDSEQNLAVLCRLCHDEMPPFNSGQEHEALSWVIKDPHRPWEWQLLTDERPPASGHDLVRRWARFLWMKLAVMNEVEAARRDSREPDLDRALSTL